MALVSIPSSVLAPHHPPLTILPKVPSQLPTMRMLLEGAVSVPDADAKVPCEEHDAQECERGEEVVAGVDERKRDDEMDVRLNQDGWDRHVEEWVLLLDGYVERDDLAGVILVVPCHWQKKMGNLVEIRENGLLAVDSRP
jgi:hypothetical protein